MLNNLYRQTVLGVAGNKLVKDVAHKQGWKLGVGRFVAGETLEAAIPALEQLEHEGLKPNLDLLGEFVDSEAGAEAMVQQILATLDRLAETKLERYMSIKPTQIGLGLSLDLAYHHMQSILKRAAQTNTHVCMDMENIPYVEKTLKLYKQLQADGFSNVSTVLQSYLHRSMADLKDILRDTDKPTLRIVKGAYKESPDVAYQDKEKVDSLYRDMVYLGLDAGAHINIATHDESIIQETSAYIRGAKLEPKQYEYQLLYGVKPNLQKRLAEEGHQVRIYVPYGKDWYGYFSRRLAERPANLMFVIRGLTG